MEGKNDKQRQTKRARLLDIWLDRPLKYRNPIATKTASGPDPKASDVEQKYQMRGDGSERTGT